MVAGSGDGLALGIVVEVETRLADEFFRCLKKLGLETLDVAC